MSDTKLAQACRDALMVQNAVNLSGVVASLARHMDTLHEAARAHGKGTHFVNTHPVSRLFAEQILHLSGGGKGDHESFENAYETCRAIINESVPTQGKGTLETGQ